MKLYRIIHSLRHDSPEDFPPAEYFDGGFDLHQSQRVLDALEHIEAKTESAQEQQPAPLARQLTAAVSEAMAHLTIRMDAQAVGTALAPVVSQEIARCAATRRYVQ